MNRESLDKLRHDRRLIRRRGWMSPAELDCALEQLPDVAGKATTLGAESDARGDAEGAAGGDGATPGT
jgi:hypothetical protein